MIALENVLVISFCLLAHVARIEFRPVFQRFQRRQVLRPLGVMKLSAAQPAALEAILEQDGVHLPGELIDLPNPVALDGLAGRVERQAVEPAKRVNFGPVGANVSVLQGDMIAGDWPASAALPRASESPDAAS